MRKGEARSERCVSRQGQVSLWLLFEMRCATPVDELSTNRGKNWSDRANKEYGDMASRAFIFAMEARCWRQAQAFACLPRVDVYALPYLLELCILDGEPSPP